VPRSKNEWSYTFIPPVRLHGVVLIKKDHTDNFTFTFYFLYQQTVPRSASIYRQVEMIISPKYMMEGMSKVSGLTVRSWRREIKIGNSILGTLSKNAYAVSFLFSGLHTHAS
jgi:hypothetical protein